MITINRVIKGDRRQGTTSLPEAALRHFVTRWLVAPSELTYILTTSLSSYSNTKWQDTSFWNNELLFFIYQAVHACNVFLLSPTETKLTQLINIFIINYELKTLDLRFRARNFSRRKRSYQVKRLDVRTKVVRDAEHFQITIRWPAEGLSQTSSTFCLMSQRLASGLVKIPLSLGCHLMVNISLISNHDASISGLSGFSFVFLLCSE